jgi:hypothetical protein
MLKLPDYVKAWFLEKPIINDLIRTKPVNHDKNYLAIKGYIAPNGRRKAAIFHFNVKSPRKKKLLCAREDDVSVQNHSWEIYHLF